MLGFSALCLFCIQSYPHFSGRIWLFFAVISPRNKQANGLYVLVRSYLLLTTCT